jgi:hypothetical protein
MKIRVPLFALICGLTALPVLRAQDAAPKRMPAKEDQTELGAKMEKISGAYRKLSKVDPTTKLAQAADPAKNDDSLAQVAIMKENAEAALKLEPVKKKDLPEADQAKFVADYQAKMKEFIASVGKLEAALKANDNATAAKLLDELKTERNDDHKAFEKQKKKKG